MYRVVLFSEGKVRRGNVWLRWSAAKVLFSLVCVVRLRYGSAWNCQGKVEYSIVMYRGGKVRFGAVMVRWCMEWYS
jgi:hypothetical protein